MAAGDSAKLRALLQRVQNFRAERLTIGAEILIPVATEIDSPDNQSMIYQALLRGFETVWIWRSTANVRGILANDLRRWIAAPAATHTYVGWWGHALGVPEILDIRREYVRRFRRPRS